MQVDLDETNTFDTNLWSHSSYNTPESEFQKAIAFGAEKDLNLNEKCVASLCQTDLGKKLAAIFSHSLWEEKVILVRGKSEVSGEVRGTVSWGGSEGTKAEVSAKVEARDENSHADVTAKVNSDGQGSVSAGAGINKDTSPSDSKDNQ